MRHFGSILSARGGESMMDSPHPRIAVVGSGYVGTVVAASFAGLGRDVVGYEIDERKLRCLQSGRAPFYEPGLDDLLASATATGRLQFTGDARSAVSEADVIFLCVGTPNGAEGRSNLTALEASIRSISAAADHDIVLVTKSTAPIGTARWLADLFEELRPMQSGRAPQLSVVSNPEFLREGSAISDFLHPDRIVLGADDRRVLEPVRRVYQPILEQTFPGGDPSRRPPLIETNLTTAEMSKYASNAFLATK